MGSPPGEALEDRSRCEGCERQRDKKGGDGSEEPGRRRAEAETIERGQWRAAQGPHLAPQLPTHCSQSHHCGRDSRSPYHSGSWLRCTRLWRHSGTAWAHTHPRGVWQLGDRAGGVGRGWTTPILTCAHSPTLSTFPRCSQGHSLISST